MNRIEHLAADVRRLSTLGVVPITPEDRPIFAARFDAKLAPSYADAWYFVTQAANGHRTGLNGLGYKYDLDDYCVAIGFHRRPSDGRICTHLINPCGDSISRTTSELCRRLFGETGWPIYVQKLPEVDARYMQDGGGFVVSTDWPWHSHAPMEDDTFPELTLDVPKSLQMLRAPRRNPIKDQLHRFLTHNPAAKCIWRNIDEDGGVAAWIVVDEFFAHKRSKGIDVSMPSDYANMIRGPQPASSSARRVLTVNGQGAGVIVLERIGASHMAGLYCSIALYHRFPNLSEYVIVSALECAEEMGCKTLNVGGSETKGLHDFKMKFSAQSSSGRPWLVFLPSAGSALHPR